MIARADQSQHQFFASEFQPCDKAPYTLFVFGRFNRSPRAVDHVFKLLQ